MYWWKKRSYLIVVTLRVAEGKGAIHALLQIVNGGKKSGGAKWRKTPDGKWYKNADEDAREEAGKRDKSSSGSNKVRSIHWSPYDRDGVVNADP